MKGFCLGIDGGGSKTEGVLTDLSGRVLAVRRGGSSNPNDVGETQAVALLADLARELMACLPQGTGGDVRLFAGVSGALARRNAMTKALANALPEAARVTVHSDVINLLSAMSPTGEGICLISGTGSACFLRHGDTLDRVGGWGYLLDSGGSGYDIGRMALEQVLKAYDGREKATTHEALTQALIAHLGDHPARIIPDIYQKGKAYIASCAPAVFCLAGEGDNVAIRILDDNAAALAACLTAAAEKAPEGACLQVVLGGSLCTREPNWPLRIKGFLPEAVSRRLVMTTTDVPPVLGALMEALADEEGLDRVAAFRDFKDAFQSSYHSQIQ